MEPDQCTDAPVRSSSSTSRCGISRPRTVLIATASACSAAFDRPVCRKRFCVSRSGRSSCARSTRCPWRCSQKLISATLPHWRDSVHGAVKGRDENLRATYILGDVTNDQKWECKVVESADRDALQPDLTWCSNWRS